MQETRVWPLGQADLTASQVALVVKNTPPSVGDLRDVDSIPGSDPLEEGMGRSPGGGHDNPLQYSCLENSMDRGAWWTVINRAAKSWTQLQGLSTHMHARAHTHTHHMEAPDRGVVHLDCQWFTREWLMLYHCTDLVICITFNASI